MFEDTKIDGLLVSLGLYAPGDCVVGFDIYPSNQV